MKTIRTVVPVLALLAPLAASADPLPEPITNLKRLTGTWKGTATLAMGKDEAKFKATYSCKSASKNFGVVCNLQANVPGMGPIETTDLWGYEPNSNTLHWFCVTNVGETHDHVAQITTDGSSRYVYQGTQGGKPFKEVIDMTMSKDGKSLDGRSESFVDGKSTVVMTFAFRK